MIATIHQPQYLPWLGYFEKADRSDVFILLDNVQFKKNDWQNRNRIKTPQGWQWLTVPIYHNFGQKILEVRINNTKNWAKNHFKSIKMNYGKAPCFANYEKKLEEIFLNDWEFLSDLNICLIENMIKWFGIKTKIVKASDYNTSSDSTQRLVDLCHSVKVDTYLSGKDGDKYMDYAKFEKASIKVETQDYQHPEHKQLWMKQNNNGFVSHLSAMDLLLNYGNDSLGIMRTKGAKV